MTDDSYDDTDRDETVHHDDDDNNNPNDEKEELLSMTFQVVDHHHHPKNDEGDVDTAANTNDWTTTTTTAIDPHTGQNAAGELWYFSYGPTVHPQVRLRRNLATSHETAAVLRHHRLTFCFGGAATVVPATGYSVHGVLMKCATPQDWDTLRVHDSGYAPQVVPVYPYGPGEFDLADEEEFYETVAPMPCNAFIFLDEFDENVMESDHLQQMEKKPQERYLRLIAQGMMKAGVIPDYVEDEILAVPFIPTRQPEDWKSFPQTKKRLPKLSPDKYHKLANEACNEIYFCLHRSILRVTSTLPDTPVQGGSTAASNWNSNAMVQMLKANAHGKPDVTHMSHVLVADPAVPWAPTPDDLTEIHYRWCENLFFDYFATSDLQAEKCYELVDKKTKASSSSRRLERWSNRLFSCVAQKPVQETGLVPAGDTKQVTTTKKQSSQKQLGKKQASSSRKQVSSKSIQTTSSSSSSPTPQQQQQQQQEAANVQVQNLNQVERQVSMLTAEKAGRASNRY